jgi:hypothetical protein
MDFSQTQIEVDVSTFFYFSDMRSPCDVQGNGQPFTSFTLGFTRARYSFN